MRNILSASNTSLKSLYLEYPSSLPDDDLVQLLRYVGKGLKSFSVHDFAAGLSQSQIDERSHIVEEILEVCPVLEILNFPDAIGSPKLFDSLVESKLRLWSFSCSKDVRPEHWLDAFERKGFPSPSSCRVYVKGEFQSISALYRLLDVGFRRCLLMTSAFRCSEQDGQRRIYAMYA